MPLRLKLTPDNANRINGTLRERDAYAAEAKHYEALAGLSNRLASVLIETEVRAAGEDVKVQRGNARTEIDADGQNWLAIDDPPGARIPVGPSNLDPVTKRQA
jgi:hypothetical protein